VGKGLAILIPTGAVAVPRDESRDFEQAVVRARARLDDLRPLLVVANELDREADPGPVSELEEDASVE
jgi:hypothetical protein